MNETHMNYIKHEIKKEDELGIIEKTQIMSELNKNKIRSLDLVGEILASICLNAMPFNRNHSDLTKSDQLIFTQCWEAVNLNLAFLFYWSYLGR